jgi:hypothetical protein
VLSRGLTALAVCAVALVGSSAVPAAADPGSCTPSVGVVVVVDFRPFCGGIERGCDPTPTTGFEAMHTAGFSTVGTQHDGPAFICRIKGLPTAAADPCVSTPPSTRYWSYWHSDPGQSGWSFSQLGASSYRPKAGSVDAWVYGGTDTAGTTGGPSFSPGSVRATAPAPPPVASPTSSAGTGGGSGGGGSGGGSGGSGGGTGGGSGGGTAGGSTGSTPGGATSPKAGTTTKAPAASPSSPGASATPAPSSASASPTTDPTSPTSTTSSASTTTTDATPSSTTDPPVTDVRAAPTAVETSAGSVWPAVGVIVLVLALGTGAGVVALRRRRAEG